MKSSIKEKLMWMTLIFFLEFAVFTTIANVFGFETADSWFAFISLFIMFGTVTWFLGWIAKCHQEYLSEIEIPIIGYSALTSLRFTIGVLISTLALGLITILLESL